MFAWLRRLLCLVFPAWQALRVFSHGDMARAAYAYGVFRQHYDARVFSGKSGGFVALDIGPGDGLLSAVIAAASGAVECYLVDTGAYAVTEISPYQEVDELLRTHGLQAPDLTGVRNL